MKIAFIGGGNMGEAILKAVLANKLSIPKEITVSDVSEARRKYLKKEYEVAVTSETLAAINSAEVIILAIKPQILTTVLSELNNRIKATQLVLSIIAGATIKKISEGLNHKRIVRSMPNTPAQIGEGMTVWTATPEVTAKQKKQAKTILGTMGQELFVEDEKYLNMATAISGSGPAYVFYLVESFVAAAEKVGWTTEEAEKLALQTLVGATHLLQKSDKTSAELRRAVTSPDGTTAAAIEQFEKGNFTGLVTQAIEAALKRAKELGK
ncbi:MAG: pyrroline-5-carboxylate reductase [Dehalococcoidales bacterium]|nr:pyrroline-5-carboxylate reductase [Dehalococcoidales bacterium]